MSSRKSVSVLAAPSIRVTPAPQEQWEKEQDAKNCHLCGCDFTLFTRKHRCRVCGRFFCAPCSEDTLTVENADAPQRACYECYIEHTAPSENELALAEGMKSKYNETLRVSQRLLFVDGKNRIKGALLIGHTLLMAVPRTPIKKPIGPYSLIDLVSITNPGSTTRLELRFHHVDVEQVLTIETSQIAFVVKAIREAHRDLSAGHNHLHLDVPPADLLPLADDKKYGSIDDNFEMHYRTLCDFHGAVMAPHVVAYVESLYARQDRHLRLLDCPGFETESPLHFQVRPLLQCLAFSNFFQSLDYEGLGTKESLFELGAMLRWNSALTSLRVANVSKFTSQLYGVGVALLNNPASSISDLSIVDVNLTKSIAALTNALAALPHGLRVLQLSNCSLNGKQLSGLVVDGLMKNYPLALGLEELDLSYNRLEQEGNETLQQFLLKVAPHCALRRLVLRKCGVNWVHITRPLQRFGCLEEIDLSYNPPDAGGIQLFLTVLEQNESIRSFIFSGCPMQDKWAEMISNTLATRKKENIRLCYSDCSFSDSTIRTLVAPFTAYPSLVSLDLSQCKLSDNHLMSLCEVLRQLPGLALENLVLNQAKMDSLLLTQKTAEAVAQHMALLVEHLPTLKRLSLCGGYSVSVLAPFMDRITTNQSLLVLRLADNKLGDAGAVALVNLLRGNKSLLSVAVDNSGISFDGLMAICYALRSNQSILRFDMPWEDMEAAMGAPSKGQRMSSLTALLRDVHTTLQANRDRRPDLVAWLNQPDNARVPLTRAYPFRSIPEEFVNDLSGEEVAALTAQTSTLSMDAGRREGNQIVHNLPSEPSMPSSSSSGQGIDLGKAPLGSDGSAPSSPPVVSPRDSQSVKDVEQAHPPSPSEYIQLEKAPQEDVSSRIPEDAFDGAPPSYEDSVPPSDSSSSE